MLADRPGASRLRGILIFAGAAAGAAALYALTRPAGLPWGVDGAAPGERALPLCALAAGLAGAVANRYLGWKVGVAAALAWIFFPGVWNGAILGDRRAACAALAVAGLWALNGVGLWVTRRARDGFREARDAADEGETRREKVNRIVSWIVLGAAGVFALASALAHDYRLGEAASAYARLVVEEAGGRIVLLNGLCDRQVEREARRRAGPGTRRTVIPFANTEENCSNLVAWVKGTWPAETNLWLAAEVGPGVFADFARKAHPDRFYLMTGETTTPERWEARWQAMAPYLASVDRFLPAMRRAFAYEGNALGNALQEQGRLKAAWKLYYRVFAEIHPGNPAACVNLNEMLRRGYAAERSARERVARAYADYAKRLQEPPRALQEAAHIAAFGPVMRDQKVCEELRERVRKGLEECARRGEKPPVRIPDLKSLAACHGEMMKAFRERDMPQAVRLARTILARKAWRRFVPAHMVLGESLMMKGDWLAAEAFLRVAAEATGAAAPPPFLLNDYAETLRQLKRGDAAEKYARRAVAESDAKTGWLHRLTLAQVLRDKAPAGTADAEIEALVAEALKFAPREARKAIRREFR